MIARFSKLVGNQRCAEYANFPTHRVGVREKMETIKFDIEYHNVKLLHFKHADGYLAVMNVHLGEVDIVDIDGEIETTYRYPNLEAGIAYCMRRSNCEN